MRAEPGKLNMDWWPRRLDGVGTTSRGPILGDACVENAPRPEVMPLLLLNEEMWPIDTVLGKPLLLLSAFIVCAPMYPMPPRDIGVLGVEGFGENRPPLFDGIAETGNCSREAECNMGVFRLL